MGNKIATKLARKRNNRRSYGALIRRHFVASAHIFYRSSLQAPRLAYQTHLGPQLVEECSAKQNV